MKSNELFSEFGKGDDDFEKARNKVSFTNFLNSIPSEITIGEFINSVFKNSFKSNDTIRIYFSERYLINTYMSLDIGATQSYVDGVLERISKLKKIVETKNDTTHIVRILDIINNYVYTNKTKLSNSMLIYLNELYKEYRN